jgi:hypothetical protein
MFFIPYDEWIEKTYSRVSSRSEKLKTLDEAIGEAEEASEDDDAVRRWFDYGGAVLPGGRIALEIEKAARGVAVAEVRKAFEAWTADQARRGQDWRKSVRNEKGAVTTLAEQIAYWTRTLPDRNERAALEFMTEQRNQSIPALFTGTRVLAYADTMTNIKDKLTKAQAVKAGVTAARLGRATHTPRPPHSGGGGGFAASISAEIDKLVREAFGTSGAVVWDHAEAAVADAVNYAISEIKDEIAALAPGVGLAAASATAVYHSVKLVMQSIAADDLVTLSRTLEMGDSRAALARVRDWQLRTIAATTAKVARAGVNVGMHAAAIATMGVGIPAQLATSLANAILGLAFVIGELGMQYKESRALTAYLNRGALGRDIFAQAPLAAAYYLLNTPDSHIALQLVTMGAPGWQADVERLKTDGGLKLALGEATSLIGAARYRIYPAVGRFRERADLALTTKVKNKILRKPHP